jgi:hypothetical protein
MKPGLLFILILSFIQGVTFGQKQANIWYFGNGAGVSFNSGAPVSICCGKTTTIEGVSTMSYRSKFVKE